MKKQINVTDVIINKLVIRSASGNYDLRPHIVELNIYENIFRPVLTANITLIDSHNLPQKLPIVGQETVDIDIKLSGMEDDKMFSLKPPPFHVNSIPNRDYLKPKSQLYSLELISEQFVSSTHSKVSKSYKDTLISSMVSDIYKTHMDHGGDGGVWVEPTDFEDTIIIPNLKPIEAIQWLAKRAKQGEDEAVNYVFFETIHGSYFRSLNSLCVIDPVVTFILRSRFDDPTGAESLSAGEIKVNKFTFLKQFDRDNAVRDGVFSSKLITHDIVRKRIHEWDYNGFINWDMIDHIGNNFPTSNSKIEAKAATTQRTSYAPPGDYNSREPDTETIGGMVDSRVSFYPKHYHMYDYEYDNQVELWKQQRDNNYGIFDGLVILIETAGVSGLRVGQIVNFKLPSAETTDRDKMSGDKFDKMLSGKYMVTAINHIIGVKDDKPVYDMKVELTKDGLNVPVKYRPSRKEE
jgi:hypothetical protein